MRILLLVTLLYAKQIVELGELENRSPDDICQEYQSNYVWTRPSKCYTPGTDCNYGTHDQTDMEWTAKRVNFFRKLTGLSTIPLSKNAVFINYTNQASLVMEKNNIFSHYLDNTSLKCWSEQAQLGASNSNIFSSSGSACSTDSIPSYIDDSNTASLGHRRWILNPPLTEVVSGLTEHYSALLIMKIDNGTETIPKFLSYPPPGPVPAGLIYKYWSFNRNYTKMWSDEHNKMPEDLKILVKCNDTVKELTPDLQGSNAAMYPAMAKFEPGNIPAGSYCKVKISSDSLDIEWRYTVLSIDCVNGTAQNVNPDAYKGEDNGYDFDVEKKKKGGSSSKDNDDDSESSAKSLGDIKIKSCYLGTSPNVYLNLNFFVKLMKSARQFLGHVVPSPEFVHSAIWVCDSENANDETVGATFVYGRYWNNKKLPSYIDKNGAKAFVMTLGEFKKRYPAMNPIKLDVNEKIGMFDFIEKVKNSGKWSADEYNWPMNNCQHFTSKLIGILKATRATPSGDDWIDLPKQVLNTLKSNEESINK